MDLAEILKPKPFTDAQRKARRRALLAMATGGGGGGGYDVVASLGSDLVEAWDVSKSARTDDGAGVISALVGLKSGYVLSAATTARPTYSATSFNGAPGLTFNGTANVMTCTTAGLLSAVPDGAEAGELWALVSQAALPADTGARYALSYGAAMATGRLVGRAVATAVNRGRVATGGGASSQVRNEGTIDLSSRHVIRAVIGATESVVYVDGVASTALTVTPSTTATRVVLGANPAASPGNFWEGVIAFGAITLPLSATKATDLQNALLVRK